MSRDGPVWTPVAEELSALNVPFAGINGNRVYFLVFPPSLRVAANEEAGPDAKD